MPPERRLRPFWSGTLSFGLVTLPVGLYPAQRSGGTRLRMLAEDGTPLSRRYAARDAQREIGQSQLLRGYEVGPEEYVLVGDEELDALAPEKSRDIDLERFVDRTELDPAAFGRAWVLAPDGDSDKAYRLLAEAMERSGRAGVATFVLRGKEHLVAILSDHGVLTAQDLRFADELRDAEAVGLPPAQKPPAAATRRWRSAVASLAADEIDEDELADPSREALEKLVAGKRRRGEDVVETEESDGEEGGADIVDLMEVLKKSLRAGGREAARRPARRRQTRPADRDLAGRSKQELYERARALDIPGRSGMTKDQLIAAIRRHA